MRTKLVNGLICDGSGSEPFRGDILIEDGVISAVGDTCGAAADTEYDCAGKLITPGFIDTHRHCDITAITDRAFGAIELSQGITSVLCGNCGLTPFPSAQETAGRYYGFLESCLGKMPPELRWASFGDYRRELERMEAGQELPVNLGAFVGTGAVRTAVKGFTPSPYTAAEMEASRTLLAESLSQGAAGISMGIMYIPEVYTNRKEFVRLLSAAPRDTVIACHMRGEGDGLVSSVEEIIGISGTAELPLNISHFKATGIHNWGREIYRAIELIENTRNRGQDVTVDFYPYTGGATMLLSLIPPALLDEELPWLASHHGKERLRAELARRDTEWENMVRMIGWERILIGSVTKEHNRKYQGASIAENCRRYGFRDGEEFTAELLADEDGKAGIILMSMSQEDVDTIARLPYSAVISDALYGSADNPHPRLYGAFTRILRDYVFDRKVLDIGTAIHKMTLMPAGRYGIEKRGALIPGWHGDIAVFDPQRLKDKATFENPKQLSTGTELVFVGGTLAWEKGVQGRKNGTGLFKSV